jgi:hypothetical protein
MHYTMERSTDLETFTPVSGGLLYGDGNTASLFVMDPLPVPVSSGQPPPPRPPKQFVVFPLYLRFATEPGVDEVIVSHGLGTIPNGWAMRLQESVPRNAGAVLGLALEEPDAIYHVTVVTTGMPQAQLENIPLTAEFNEVMAKTRDLFLNHKAEIYGALTHGPAAVPIPPVPTEPVLNARYFYRVVERPIDTNGNGLYDWWELANDYDPFLDLEDPRAAKASDRNASTGQTNLEQQASITNPPSAGGSDESISNDNYMDSDQDGLTDLEELTLGTNPTLKDSDADSVGDAEDAHPSEPLLTFARYSIPHYASVEVGWGTFLDANDAGQVIYKKTLAVANYGNKKFCFLWNHSQPGEVSFPTDNQDDVGSGNSPTKYYNYSRINDLGLLVGNGSEEKSVSGTNPPQLQLFVKGFSKTVQGLLDWFGEEDSSGNDPEERPEPILELENEGSFCTSGNPVFEAHPMGLHVSHLDNFGNAYGSRTRSISSGVLKATVSVPALEIAEAPILWAQGNSGQIIAGGEKVTFNPSQTGNQTRRIIDLNHVTPLGRRIIAKSDVTYKTEVEPLPANSEKNICSESLVRYTFTAETPVHLQTIYSKATQTPANDGGIPDESVILQGGDADLNEVCCLNDMAKGQADQTSLAAYGCGPIAGGMKEGKACFWVFQNGAWKSGYVLTSAAGQPAQHIQGKIKHIDNQGRIWIQKTGESTYYLWFQRRLIPLTSLIPDGTGDAKKFLASGSLVMSAGDQIHLLLPTQIQSLSFNVAPTHRLQPDDGAVNFQAPHWVDDNQDGIARTNPPNNERNYPVAFNCNSGLSLSGQISIKGVPPNATVLARAYSNTNVTIPATELSALSDGLFQLPTVSSSGTFPNSIQCYFQKDNTAFTLQWEVQINGGAWSKIGSTKHTVYLTLGTPSESISTYRKETLFHLACKHARGVTQAADVFAKIWSAFHLDQKIARVDGKPLRYYADYNSESATTYELLQTQDGQCGAWVKLLIDAQRVHGITETGDLILIEPLVGTGFIVNSWNFAAQGRGGNAQYPYLNIRQEPWKLAGGYQWRYSEVADAAGVPAQGNLNPASLFQFHYLLKKNTKYYDPSYGQEYASFDAFETASLAGYYTQGDYQVDETAIHFDVNSDGDTQDAAVQTPSIRFKLNTVGNELREEPTTYP